MIIRTFLALLALAVTFNGRLVAKEPTSQGPKIVMIVRHAEKPDDSKTNKDPDLSEQGFARANALAKVIPEHFPRPDFLIATKRSKNSNRPIETIMPLSRALGETIEANEKDDDFAKLSNELLTDPKYDGKVVLIAWHHGKIPALAKALGVSDAPSTWDSKVFDRVWEIDYEKGHATLKDLPQKALPDDSQQ